LPLQGFHFSCGKAEVLFEEPFENFHDSNSAHFPRCFTNNTQAHRIESNLRHAQRINHWILGNQKGINLRHGGKPEV
jgi:hypothetical protein